MKKSNAYFLLTLSMPLWLLAGCSLPFSEPAPEPNATAQTLLKEGNQALKEKSYGRALVYYETIQSEFPFSAEAKDIALKVAEAQHLNEQYEEATEAYKEFLRFHPTNPKVPYVLYQLGEVHLDQFKSIDRDRKIIETAESYYETLINNHPHSPYAAEAKDRLARCRRYLAEREFYIGEFYFKEEKYLAARERFTNVVREYPDVPVAVRALYQLGETYRLQKNSVKARLAYESIVRHYPDNPLAEQARIELSKLENTDQDPLALLLQRDGRPMPVVPSGDDRLYAAGAPGRLAAAPAASGPEDVENLNLVQKKGVDYEEGYEQRQGVFSGLVAAINPFDSSDGKGDGDADGKERSDLGSSSDNGTSANTGNGATDQSQTEPRGFFTRIARNINPFASGGQGEADRDGGTPVSDDNSTTQGDGTTGAVIDSIDRSLEQKGIENTDERTVLRPAALELPPNPEEPPPTDAKEVLQAIDTGLKSEGLPAPLASREAGKENVSFPTPPVEASSTLFAGRKEEEPPTKTNPPDAAVLGAIDKELKQKGIEVEAKQQPSGRGTASEGEAAASVEASATPIRTEELSPRLETSNSPLLLPPGQFQPEEKPAPADGPAEEKKATAASAGSRPESSETLSDAVLNDPWRTPPKKKTESAESTKGDPGTENPPEGVVEQLKDEAGNFKHLLNPFGF